MERDQGEEPDDRGWARDGAGPERRRRLTPFKLVYTALLALGTVYIAGTLLLDAVDLVMIRRYGTPGTFELIECHDRRGYRTAPYQVCEASFTGDDGSRREPVWIAGYGSMERVTTRTGVLRGSQGVTDDVNAFAWVLPGLITPVIAAGIGWYLIRYYLGHEDRPGVVDDREERRRERRRAATREGWTSW